MRKRSIRVGSGAATSPDVVHVEVVQVHGSGGRGLLREAIHTVVAVGGIRSGVHGHGLVHRICSHAAHFHPQPILAPLFQRVEGERLTLARQKVSSASTARVVAVLQNVTGLAPWRLLALLLLLLLLSGPLQFVHGNEQVVEERVWPVSPLVAGRGRR